jgi:hypothetical protein
MEINLIGLVAAISAFLGIWLGHVSVRVIERKAEKLWLPIVIAIGIGLTLEVISVSAINRLLSVATGIIGVTVLWDAFEFIRQERRVKKGHAPANPENPRHAKFMAAYPSATTLDLLNRNPVGREVTEGEAAQLVQSVSRSKP